MIITNLLRFCEIIYNPQVYKYIPVIKISRALYISNSDSTIYSFTKPQYLQFYL